MIHRTDYVGKIKKEDIGREVVVAGWIQKVKALGQITFAYLRDISGIIQVTAVKGECSDDVFYTLSSVVRESVVAVKGKVVSSEQKNADVEIFPIDIDILSVANAPLPLGVADKVNSDLDTRLDSRFLDLRRPEVNAVFKIRSCVGESVRKTLADNGFMEVSTPKIVAAATEGGTNLFPIKYFDKEAYMNQSPQLFKQMLMGAGMDRVFEIGPAFRMEKHATPRHINEFTSIDIEMSFSDDEDAMHMLELVIRNAVKYVVEKCPEELNSMKDLVKRINNVIESDNVQIRKENKKIKAENKGRRKQGLEEKPLLPLIESIEFTFPEVPDVPFPRITYSEALDIANEALETKIEWGEDLSMEATRVLAAKYPGLYFIKDWPASIKPFYAMPHEDDNTLTRSFDLMFAEKEITSGAQRIHDVNMLERSLRNKGLNPEDFEFYLNAFRYGMPPHGGWGLGMERLMLMITGLNNIRECVLFPRDRWRLMP